MNRIIYKYPLNNTGVTLVQMPKEAQILCVQQQHEMPFIWALVDPDNDDANEFFRMYGTGHPIEDSDKLEYISTFQVQDGNLVFHIFREL